MKKCPECEHECKNEFNFCDMCGYNYSEGESMNNDKESNVVEKTEKINYAIGISRGLKDIFSMKGRLSRIEYFINCIVISIFQVILIFFVTLVEAESSTMTALNVIVIYTVIIVLSGFQVVKRLHDLDRPSTDYWLLYIPIYNIFIIFMLLFQKGVSEGVESKKNDS